MGLIRVLKSLNTNLVIAVTALLVSACALYISVQEVRIMRTQQNATMYPYVTVGMRYNGEGFGLELKNSGNGLARINSYQLYSGDTYFNDWFEAGQKLAPEVAGAIDYGIISTDGNIRDQMIAPGESKNLIFIKWSPESRILEKEIYKLKVRICYSSLLDEHWVINDRKPEEIDRPCEYIPEHEFEGR